MVCQNWLMGLLDWAIVSERETSLWGFPVFLLFPYTLNLLLGLNWLNVFTPKEEKGYKGEERRVNWDPDSIAFIRADRGVHYCTIAQCLPTYLTFQFQRVPIDYALKPKTKYRIQFTKGKPCGVRSASSRTHSTLFAKKHSISYTMLQYWHPGNVYAQSNDDMPCIFCHTFAICIYACI